MAKPEQDRRLWPSPNRTANNSLVQTVFILHSSSHFCFILPNQNQNQPLNLQSVIAVSSIHILSTTDMYCGCGMAIGRRSLKAENTVEKSAEGFGSPPEYSTHVPLSNNLLQGALDRYKRLRAQRKVVKHIRWSEAIGQGEAADQVRRSMISPQIPSRA